jgi:hypothetical protein
MGFAFVGHFPSLTFSPGRTRKSFELILIFIRFGHGSRVVRLCLFMGCMFLNLALRLLQVLDCPNFLAP